ncbi:beta-glucosidase-related glycosidase [Bifidobacterium lemurum]|uniref:Beta-glucosidase-related glycosidase n=1 Tax=Bifidobacterium lemurum TaxID=1603886 RepID=A0A261FK58_9BIFI|nr:glycoside hydrolase family 3 N-terminal domain-containing protein [Bifidobacterium lemurum]OZG59554.1 beta-glucosidase-related glycosidase [Bifidobacterium lemurum]QOL35020.1 glycoside hydrolase family 3 C-terminal domain-containing protein [Bifidobacterium lemurum]
MLQINMADVITVLESVAPYLIAIAVVLVLAVVTTVVTNTRRMPQEATRKLIHSQSWLVVFVAMVVAIVMMLFGPLSNLITMSTGEKYTLSESSIDSANELATDIQREAVTLLQNDEANLPLGSTKVNVFGWASTNPVYGGTGSGSMNDQYATTSLLDGMKDAGLETNTELSDLYTQYRADRPEVGMWEQDWTLPEVPADQYSDDLISNAKSFSDQAVIVIARVGGEGADLPTNMKADGITYTDNSTEYEDFADGAHFLELSQTERNMVDLVTENFDNVTVVYNGANAFELDFVDAYPQIKSVLWCPPAGQTGFAALGEILTGATNPSGKTSDTFARDLTATPTFNNFGSFYYDNMSEFNTENRGEVRKPSFVNYVEGIYVGYKFYETAADEGLIDYDATVQYPFGYGLSYTTFSQEMGDVTYADGTVSFDVTVTNTGDTAGKDVVEVYYNPPYTNGGIEKATANLVEFDKTDLLEPGESQTLTVEFEDDDMASYDSENAEAYVLEAGDYVVSINSDSHTVIDEQTVTVDETITYDTEDNTHDGDQIVATNQFDNAEGHVTYLSRADQFANYTQATAAPESLSMAEDLKAQFTNISNYDLESRNDSDDEMPVTGADNGIRLADLRGVDYDDEQWDALLDQLTFEQMDDLIALAGYGTQAIDSIGKVALTDSDGPAALNNNFTGAASIGFPASTSVACTWNQDLATQYGEMMGQMARELSIHGWYAPAMNIHRSAFAGRNFEYFSEDGYLSGVMASSQIAGARTKGVYAFMKHFALNDQETNRASMLCTWADEQAIREIYLKPFEMSVKQGGAQAVMSSFNYIGTTWAGGSANLLQTVLRDEWGFRGFVLTDYFEGAGYMYADEGIRNGNDAMLAPMDGTNHITDQSATSIKAMRNASHNILYTAVNSWAYENGEPKTTMLMWQRLTYAAVAVAAVAFIALETLTVRRYFARRKAETAQVGLA